MKEILVTKNNSLLLYHHPECFFSVSLRGTIVYIPFDKGDSFFKTCHPDTAVLRVEGSKETETRFFITFRMTGTPCVPLCKGGVFTTQNPGILFCTRQQSIFF